LKHTKILPIAASLSIEDVSGSETTTQGSVLAPVSEDEIANFPTSVGNLSIPDDEDCKGGGGGMLRTRDLNRLPVVRATKKLKRFELLNEKKNI
jgi:hypothetical protein